MAQRPLRGANSGLTGAIDLMHEDCLKKDSLNVVSRVVLVDKPGLQDYVNFHLSRPSKVVGSCYCLI
jgi:hypothetical protein